MGCAQSSDDASSYKIGRHSAKSNERDRKNAKDENLQYQAKMQFLSKVQLMTRLPKDQHPLVASACEVQHFNTGDAVIRQGEAGDEFFVIWHGEATVYTRDKMGGMCKVAALTVGDYFGENALLRDEPRTATIIAETALSTFKITRRKFQELGLNEKLQFANRRAVGAGEAKGVVSKPPSPKTAQDRLLITAALRGNENLQTMATLDDSRVNAMIEVAWREEIAAGQEVISEGDLCADYFYIVAAGSFEVILNDSDGGSSPQVHSAETMVRRGEAKVVGSLGVGSSFGELALFYLVPRAATVKATERSAVWVIDRSNFKRILMKVSDDKVKEYIRYLDGVNILSPLLQGEKYEVAKALAEMHFVQSEVILQQGEPGNTFYILYSGSVAIIKDGEVVKELTASVSQGTAQYFGERALLDNEVRGATVKVTSSTAKALVLDRDAFNLLLGPLKDIIEKSRTEGGRERSALAGGRPDGLRHDRASSKDPLEVRPKILRKDLSKIGLLGCGGFGTVELWEHKVTQETYALKGLSKGYIVKTGMQDSVMNEKDILMMTNSPFIIKLHETYNGSQSLFFLLEPALGGELYATYNRKGLHGSEPHAKYYVAGVVFAFEHLHERRIIYRDLKPENLLLTEKGHLKMADMGLAKFVIGKSYTTCGTPDYFAPELIATIGHTNAVDWWTLGVLIFELMSGHPPFESAYPMQIYSKVMKGIGMVTMPPKCQGPCGDLIKGLLKKEPSERLPMRPGGIQNLRGQKWFEGFDWDAMCDMSMEAPYQPLVTSKKDLANFRARKEDMPRQIKYDAALHGDWDKDFATA